MDTEMQVRFANCKTLPTLPGVAIQILDLCEQEDVDFSRLAGVIAQDPALSARVLQIVNSPYYALPRRVATLDHAAVLLGAHAVRTVALGFSIVKGLRQDGTPDSDLSTFWRRALIAGVAARQLGQWAKTPDQEVLFLAALLQDIGMLALRSVFPSQYEEILIRSEGDHLRLIDIEKAELGTDHAEISGWLVAQWQLPKIFEVSLRGSHDPNEVASKLLLPVQIVALSGLFADIWIIEDAIAAGKYAATSAREMLNMEAGGFPKYSNGNCQVPSGNLHPV